MIALKPKILSRQTGLLFYGLTPPKLQTDPEKMAAIAARHAARLRPETLGFALDGLVLYDLQDESARTDQPRPFPFLQTVPPEAYARDFLRDLPIPKIIYQGVGKHSPASLEGWLRQAASAAEAVVFVGSPSKHQIQSMNLREAYAWKQAVAPDWTLGGIAIPERHARKGDEHERVFAKMRQGCRFFVTQCVYSVEPAKDFLSDYAYGVEAAGLKPVPLIFTLTPCGSTKSLQFMEWLGIAIPRWLKNDLNHTRDIMRQSLDACLAIAKELQAFAAAKGLPIGFNIESVAIRKEEIEASMELVASVRRLQTGRD